MIISCGESVTVRNLIRNLEENLGSNYMGMANVRVSYKPTAFREHFEKLLVIELIDNDKAESILISKVNEREEVLVTKQIWWKRLLRWLAQ